MRGSSVAQSVGQPDSAARLANIRRSPSVAMTPGETQLAVMPEPARWCAKLTVRLGTAALAAEYSTMLVSGIVAPRVPTVTMRPQPLARIDGSIARVNRTMDT